MAALRIVAAGLCSSARHISTRTCSFNALQAGLGYLLRHLRYYEVVRALEKQLQDAGVSVPKPA